MNNNSTAVKRGERLKALRKLAGFTRKKFEEDYDISAGTLRSWEEGRHTGLTEQGAKRLVLVFRNLGVNVSIGWLLNGNGEPPQLNRVLSTTNERLESTKEIMDKSFSQALADIKSFCFSQTDPIFMEIKDDSMLPVYEINTIVAGTRYFDKNIKKALYKNCIIELTDGKMLTRYLKPGALEDRYTLVSLNTYSHVDDTILANIEIVSAAPIIITRKKDN